MDAGAVAGWPARYNHDELSAIQHAMNLKLDDEDAFMSEYQNEPIVMEQGDGPMLTADQIAHKTNGVGRGVVPVEAEHLTAFVDVHDTLLYYVVAAWSGNFTGWVIDHGTLPDQQVRHFAMRKAPRTLASLHGGGKEASIRAGLDELTQSLLGREWEREDGAAMRIERCLIDSGYVSAVVEDICRHSIHAAVLMPSRGIGIGAAGRPMTEYDKHRGDRIGFNWLVPKTTDRGAMRHFRFDSNFWKSFVHARLATPLGDAGCLSLFGRSRDEHKLIADHLIAEAPIRTSGQGRTVDEWRQKPNRPDNHFADCLVGCAAAASYCGAVLPGSGASQRKQPKKRISFREWQQQARKRRGDAPAWHPAR
jgi:phage terminase large subunit GpA-like protein